MQAGEVIQKLAIADRTELVAMVTHELATEGLTGALESAFEFYCMGAEANVADTLKGFMFYKFVRDCNLLEVGLADA